jgi:hypothetical protein
MTKQRARNLAAFLLFASCITAVAKKKEHGVKACHQSRHTQWRSIEFDRGGEPKAHPGHDSHRTLPSADGIEIKSHLTQTGILMEGISVH